MIALQDVIYMLNTFAIAYDQIELYLFVRWTCAEFDDHYILPNC